MGKKKCKIKKTISTIWKENMGPFLTIVWEWIVKGLKFGGKLAVRVIGLAVFGTVIIIPFLHNCIDHTLAQWLWYPAGVGALFHDLCKHGKWHKIQNGDRAGKSQGGLPPVIAY